MTLAGPDGIVCTDETVRKAEAPYYPIVPGGIDVHVVANSRALAAAASQWPKHGRIHHGLACPHGGVHPPAVERDVREASSCGGRDAIL